MIRPAAKWALAGLLLVALAAAVGWWAMREARRAWAPDPQVIAAASLAGLREQSRLSVLVARYVAVVTARQQRFGLSAQKTLIMPGNVRYEVDLARLKPADLRWRAEARTLDVVLPPVEVAGPEIDLTQLREYDAGGLLMRLTDAETALDAVNRRAGQIELIRQAREPVPMSLARDAARRAVERSFALPLRAAGLNATVRVRFPDEPGFRTPDPSQVERSRSLEEVYGQ